MKPDRKYCTKKLLAYLFLSIIITFESYSQQINCDYYKNDRNYYKACKIYTKACKYSQGSKKSQTGLERAIKTCFYFAPAYYVKAIPFLKRGEFIEWKELIDKAVEYDSLSYLGYRGGCRFQFLRDYNGAINDIEQLLTIASSDIGYIYNGDYHLVVILALSYKGIGNYTKAIEILEQFITSENYHEGLYDYYHFGVLKYECRDYEGAINALNKQIEINDYLAESYFYLALCCKMLGDMEKYVSNLTNAKEYFMQGKELPGQNSFMDYMDKVYLSEIESEFEKTLK